MSRDLDGESAGSNRPEEDSPSCVVFGKTRVQVRATAPLIAAASDLLLELRSLVAGSPSGKHSEGIERIRRSKLARACERCASALALIAKVEGH